MKNNPILLTLTVAAALTAASCARKEPPAVVVEQQQSPIPSAGAQPSEPVRVSAWKAAPIRSSQPKPIQPPMQVQTEPAPKPAPPVPQPPSIYTPAPAPVAQSRPAQPPPPPPQPMKVTLPEGAILAVRISETMTSERNENGDSWSGSLNEPLVIDGMVIAERGSRVEGRITDLKRAGRVKGVASLSLALTRFQTADGQRIAIQTAAITHLGKDETKRDVGKIAIASGIGAAIGAIAGGGKGAGIGAGTGAAAGTGAVLVTRGGPAVVATESLLRFRIQEPVTIIEKVR